MEEVRQRHVVGSVLFHFVGIVMPRCAVLVTADASDENQAALQRKLLDSHPLRGVAHSLVHDIKAVGGQSAHACRQLHLRLLIDDLVAPNAAQEFGLLWRAARARESFAAVLLEKLHLDASCAATGSSDKGNLQRLGSAQLADRHGSRWPAEVDGHVLAVLLKYAPVCLRGHILVLAVATGTVHHHCIANGDVLAAISEANDLTKGLKAKVVRHSVLRTRKRPLSTWSGIGKDAILVAFWKSLCPSRQPATSGTSFE